MAGVAPEPMAGNRWTYELTEPVYAQLRKVIPPVAGLDLSPLFLIFGLQGLSWLLWQTLG